MSSYHTAEILNFFSHLNWAADEKGLLVLKSRGNGSWIFFVNGSVYGELTKMKMLEECKKSV